MKVAFIIFNGMTALDFVGIYDPVTRLKTMNFIPDLEWDLCALTSEVVDGSGLAVKPTQVGGSLAGYDLVIVPGGFATRELLQTTAFMDWFKTMAAVPLKASVCTGSLLLGAAGYLKDKRATTHHQQYELLRPYCREVLPDRIVDEGGVITAGGVTSALELGLYLCEKFAGSDAEKKIRRQMDYPFPPPPAPRRARLERRTSETQIAIELNLEGSGQHEIATGVGFLDHMLTHIAVHGLFDLTVKASGDLHIDVHHTVEDVALVLGSAFDQALGDRKGIVRMASFYAPMDETLAFVTLDLSGRPYSVIDAEWGSAPVGQIPTSLFPHFFESFAVTSRSNLHARILHGRDDHHKAEALFKALARALDAATTVDERRKTVPSTKGTLTK
jgi:imidazoleglycerol-phosphate dehydratase